MSFNKSISPDIYASDVNYALHTVFFFLFPDLNNQNRLAEEEEKSCDSDGVKAFCCNQTSSV